MRCRAMKKNRSLQNMLRDHTITADQFLQTQGIAAQIRSNLSRFVDYTRTHRPFAIRMLQLAFNISYAQLEDPALRSASYAAHEVFGNEEPEVAELFFEPPPSEEKPSKSNNSEVLEGIQSEAQRLFQFDSEEDETLPAEEARPVEITGEELVTLSLEALKSEEVNETCLGHLQKMYSFFIRHEPIPVLDYFEKHPQCVQLLLTNIKYSSVSSLVAQLLTSEDKKKEYKYQPLKKRMLQRVVEQIFTKMQDQCFFDGALAFLDQILSSTKQSYYEYFEDFKRIANYVVSENVLKRFYEQLFKLNQPSFCNASRFLENLFVRINNQVEDSRYYHKEDQNEQTMDFQIGIFLQNIPPLFTLTPKINHFSSLTKIHYLSFLDALLKTTQVKASPPSLRQPSFIALFEAYRLQTSAGMYKNKIYTLINGILSRASEAEAKEFLQNHPQIYEQYFTIVKAANYANTKVYNKNEGSAFDVSLIAKLTRKEQSPLLAASKVIGKDLKRMCKKYDTKIASFQSTSSFSLEEESNFYQYNNQIVKNSEGNSGFSLNFVGKNNISIPVLHLPEKFSNLQKKEKDLSPEIPPNELSDSPKEIVEVEEVVSLTSKLQTFKKLNRIDLPEAMVEESKRQRQKQSEGKWPEDLVIPKQEIWGKDQDEDKVEDKAGQQITNQSIDLKAKEDGLKVSLKEESVVKLKGDTEKARFFARHLAIFC